MPSDDKPPHPFVILVASDTDHVERAVRSVLENTGYSVVTASSGRAAIEMALSSAPDAVLLDTHLPDGPGIDVCRRLSGDASVSATVPIILTASYPQDRAGRVEAYAAGAWDVCAHPLDGAILLLKLQTFLRARSASERLRSASLLDDATGLYNTNGLTWRTGELAADASRRREALACVAFAPELPVDMPSDARLAIARRVASSWRAYARGSDVLGRTSDMEFAIVAPATNAQGAERMIDRFQGLLADPVSMEHPIRLRAGYCATADFAQSSLEPSEILTQARVALHDSTRAARQGWSTGASHPFADQ